VKPLTPLQFALLTSEGTADHDTPEARMLPELARDGLMLRRTRPSDGGDSYRRTPSGEHAVRIHLAYLLSGGAT
jgi:hypothetical protein